MQVEVTLGGATVVVSRAILALRGRQVALGAAVADPTDATEQAARPVRIPVVVESATDTKGSGQLEVAGAAGRDRTVDGIGGGAEGDAARVAELAGPPPAIRKLGEGPLVEITSLVSPREGRIDLDVVAGAGRHVLDLQGRHHRAAPLRAG